MCRNASRAVLVVLIWSLWITGSQAKLVVFGDSLSETGNFSLFTSGYLPPSPLYPQRRFTNGLVWIDYLARELRQPAVEPSLSEGSNYAFNGSRAAGGSPYQTPDLMQQVGMFLHVSSGQAEADDIFVIWCGANDIYFGAAAQEPDFIVNAVSNIQTAMATLYQAGARNFIVANLPPLGSVPYFLNAPLEAGQLDLASAAFNQLLAATLQQAVPQFPGLRLAYLDIAQLFAEMTGLPQRVQLDDTTTACTLFDPSSNISLGFALRDGVDPSRFLFWDGVHPTTRTHEIIAKRARQVARMHLSPIRN